MTFPLSKTPQISKRPIKAPVRVSFRLAAFSVLCATIAILSGSAAGSAQEPPIRFIDQGNQWTPELRALYYTQDQGSQLIPLVWLKALKQPNGRAFTEDALARYGYLSNPYQTNDTGLPAGFSVANSQQGPMVGVTCAACHTREIVAQGAPIRIDGGPALADFQSFLVDLDAAVQAVLVDDDTFKAFAASALGAEAAKPEAVKALHDAVSLWSRRFHAIVSRSVPKDKPWGPGRLDAISMIYNRLNGLDLGPAPTFMLPDNMAIADAPTRYPFLWNAGKQDKTQWGGWAANGNDSLALARNLGQVMGVFAAFHPDPKTATTPLDRDYLSANSANITGLATVEDVLTRLGPPVWPFPVSKELAERGWEIFNRPASEGGCAECHGIAEGEARPPSPQTWRTVLADAGTDLRQWQIVLRSAKTGALQGAEVQGVVGPLKETDLSLNILKAAVTGTLFQLQAAQAVQAAAAQAPHPDSMTKDATTPHQTADAPSPVMAMTHKDMVMAMRAPEATTKTEEAAPAQQAAAPGTFVYEARVLQGIWAAAPYLHNGSVPTLAELLKPAAERVKQFKVGPAYDTHSVGLASEQRTAFTLTTTGCEDRNSGNSNCGHEYGTQLSPEDKGALLEYLKTL
jgi:mono/diheme cytochrome c family protein